MKMSKSALVYMALALGAIAAIAFVALRDPATTGGSADMTAAAELRTGDMKKLNFHPEPRPASSKPFVTPDESTVSLEDYRGKVVLLNFWATWCPPCRKEMPMLEEIARDLNGDDFAVVTLATGRNAQHAITAFFNEIGVETLPEYRDPTQDIAREMAVLGLPVTVLIDREGREIARMTGDADWSSESARAVLNEVINATRPTTEN